MGRFTVVVSVLCALAACSDNKKQGLPPAQEWSADPTGGAQAQSGGNNPHAGMAGNAAGANPHAGLGANPHAGLGADDPHAGLDMSNPHGGGTDVSKLGLPAPDPNRKIDPTHKVSGVLRIHPKAKDRVKAGTAVFVIVKRAGSDGAPSGPPLAVDRLEWNGKDEMPFEMTEAQAMIAGTQLVGDVVVLARYDQDSDALSKQPGDVTGEIRVKVPSDKVVVTLDNVLN